MHVKFMSYKIEKVITEELLRNLFSIYGEVSDTTIKQISIDRVSKCIATTWSCVSFAFFE